MITSQRLARLRREGIRFDPMVADGVGMAVPTSGPATGSPRSMAGADSAPGPADPAYLLGQMTGALVVFCVTYLVIASRQLAILRLDRPGGALIGAVAMVVVGGMPLDAAFHAVKLDVIALLLGVLIIAAYLQEAKFFRRASWVVLTRARSARSLLWGLIFVAGGLSALLVNDTVCVVLTPLVLAVVVEANLPAMPYL